MVMEREGRVTAIRDRIAFWYRQRPALLVTAIVIATALSGLAVEAGLHAVEEATGQPRALLLTVLFGIAAVAALASLILFSGGGGGTPPLPEDFSVVTSFSSAELRELRNGLHQTIYGGSAPNGAEIDEMYRRNPRMGVGIRDERSRNFVAFATGWPLTDDAARRIIAGEMDENALVADDVLPANRNGDANFVLVPAFGAAPRMRERLGSILYYEMRSAMRRNFFDDRNKTLTLIATGFSPDGKKWCERRLGMSAQCHVPFGKDECPIYARKIVYEDVA